MPHTSRKNKRVARLREEAQEKRSILCYSEGRRVAKADSEPILEEEVRELLRAFEAGLRSSAPPLPTAAPRPPATSTAAKKGKQQKPQQQEVDTNAATPQSGLQTSSSSSSGLPGESSVAAWMGDSS